MQVLVKKALTLAAPSAVTGADKQADFVLDFMNFDTPGLSYKKMKENSKNTFLNNEDWQSTWHTNGYFKDAESDFAFRLYELLANMPLTEATESFVVPRYIRDAIRFVVKGRIEGDGADDGADN